jgi:hypothetical protein
MPVTDQAQQTRLRSAIATGISKEKSPYSSFKVIRRCGSRFWVCWSGGGAGRRMTRWIVEEIAASGDSVCAVARCHYL